MNQAKAIAIYKSLKARCLALHEEREDAMACEGMTMVLPAFCTCGAAHLTGAGSECKLLDELAHGGNDAVWAAKADQLDAQLHAAGK